MEMSKEAEEAKKDFLAFILNFFDIKKIHSSNLQSKIMQMHIYICKLENEKYDLEKYLELQNNYIEEMTKDSQKVAISFKSKGLQPPKIKVYKAYDRQVDRRNYAERRKIFEKQSEMTKTERSVKIPGKLVLTNLH